MTRRSTMEINTVLFLQILAAAYLVVLGIRGIQDYNSAINELGRSIASLFGKSTNPFNLVFAICTIAAGGALLATLFLPGLRIAFYVNAAVLLFWIVRIVIFCFINGIVFGKNEITFKPDFLEWLTGLIMDLILLAIIWQVSGKKN